MRHRAVTLATALAVVAALLASAAGARRDATPARRIVVYADVRIGSFEVKEDGTLAGAIRAFGRPTRIRRTDRIVCLVRWRRLGLRIGFYNLGGQNPCDPRYGAFGQALMVGTRWETLKGLRLGDSTRKMRALYRPRRRTGWWIWLITRSTRADCPGVCYYPGLAAKVLRGRVAAFRVSYAAGGV